MWLFDLFFASFPQHWYNEVRISRSVSESPLEFEKTRVDCIYGGISGLDHLLLDINMNINAGVYLCWDI